MSVDNEDVVRQLRGRLAWCTTLKHSDEFRFFLSLIDEKIERARLELEKGVSVDDMHVAIGRMRALRSIGGILTAEATEVTNKMRARGATV